MKTGKSNKGFTLLELLVALTIFSLISITVYSSLDSMVSTREHLATGSEQLRALQTALRIIGRDIEQAVDRPVRSEYEEELPALRWTESPETLALTANGHRNPAGRVRSNLQRIAFRLDDKKLVRDSWPVLDRSVDTKPFSQILVAGIERFEVSFIDQDEKVMHVWPPTMTIPSGPIQPLPRAVNIQLEIDGWGRIDRLFLIGGSK